MITLANADLTIELKNPEFLDNYDVDVQATFRTARSGQLRSTKKTAITKFVLTFVELSRNKAMELRNFLIQSAGQNITYTDYNGDSWQCLLLTDAFDISTGSRGPGITSRKEANNITLELEVL